MTTDMITNFFQQIGQTIAQSTHQSYQFYQENPTFQHHTHGIILFFAIFLIYLETKIKGIFFRPDSTNQVRFNPFGFTGFLTYPFISTDPWRLENWDLNFIIFTQLGALAYTLLRFF